MAGYSIMIKEISNQTNKYITHVFLQAGVGGMAAGSVAGIARYFKRIPKIIVVEPTNAAIDAKKNGHKIYQEFFEKKTADKIIKKYKKIDLIIFTNVFAHIENLNELINNLKYLISKNTILLIENHYLGSVISKNQFDTFYHEHPRTYSATSFIHISKKLNMSIKKVEFPMI